MAVACAWEQRSRGAIARVHFMRFSGSQMGLAASSRSRYQHAVSNTPKIWRLQSGLDRRFKTGHPWVYSNELQGSPKGITPGDPIELHDAGGKFLARGYGNPASLIAFRLLTRDPAFTDPMSPA